MEKEYEFYKKQINNSIILLVLSFIATILEVLRVVCTDNITFLFLIWNLFLCWLPYLIALCIYIVSVISRKNYSKVFLLILGFIWLLFFPNAPYIITDYIHFSYFDYFVPLQNGAINYIANADLSVWFDFIIFSTFIITGFLLGLYSIYLIHKVLILKTNKQISWVFVLAIFLLSGFGIYLGRFLRFNSWDIVTHPINLLKDIIGVINTNSISFSMMFGTFLFIIYLAFYKTR